MASNTELLTSPAAREAVAQPAAPSITKAIAAIAADARSAPEAYLRETEVPYGGE